MIKILDCFPYFNEKELLELRLRLLWDEVDQFIITEGDHTFSGQPKELTLKQTLNDLGLYDKDKITVIEVAMPSKAEEPWNHIRENMQRDAAAQYITPDTVAIVSDCDEIVDPTCIQDLGITALENPNNIVRIPMFYLSGRADLEVHTSTGQKRPWNAGFICLPLHAVQFTLSVLREHHSNPQLNHDVPYSSIVMNEHQEVPAGWHMTWMGDSNNHKNKFTSFEHCDDVIHNTPYGNDNAGMLKFMEGYIPDEGATDVLGRSDHILKRLDLVNLPLKLFEYKHLRDFLMPSHPKHIEHDWDTTKYGEEWFGYPNLYQDIVNSFADGSRFVEIGCWKGRSASFMATEIHNQGKQIELTCIDTWRGSEDHQQIDGIDRLYETFCTNTQHLSGLFKAVRMDSVTAASTFTDESLDFIFIDAAHDYDSVVRDIYAWWPKLKKGGVIAGDDYYEEFPDRCGVYYAVKRIFNYFEVQDTAWIVTKQINSVMDFVKHYCRLITKIDLDHEDVIEYYDVVQSVLPVKMVTSHTEEDDSVSVIVTEYEGENGLHIYDIVLKEQASIEEGEEISDMLYEEFDFDFDFETSMEI